MKKYKNKGRHKNIDNITYNYVSDVHKFKFGSCDLGYILFLYFPYNCYIGYSSLSESINIQTKFLMKRNNKILYF